jgi:hypothetical protein
MSSIGGSPIDTSLLQTAQVQQQASKARDKEKASEPGRRIEDLVDLRIAGTESDQAVRQLPSNDSEQADREHEAQDKPKRQRRADNDENQGQHVDVEA